MSLTVIRLHPMPQLIKNTSVGYKHSLDAFISVLIIKICLSTSRLTQRYFKPWKQVARNHHTAISSTQQVSRHDEGSIRPPLIVAYRPLSFPVKCGWIYVCRAPYTPAQLRSLSNVIYFPVVMGMFDIHILWIWNHSQEIFGFYGTWNYYNFPCQESSNTSHLQFPYLSWLFGR